MNKTILMGRLTKDPEVKYLQNENSTAMARYTLAVDRRYRKDGKAETDFISAYSCAMKSHFRKFGNQMSGSGNHLCEFTRAVFYLDHTPPAWTCHAQHQYL